MPEAIEAIASADLITVGPGSLFTSLLPPLLVHGVSEAIAHALATRVFVSNLMTQPGETDDFSVWRHLEIIRQYAPEIEFDHVVLNSEPISTGQQAKYAEEHAIQIGIDETNSLAEAYGANVVCANLLDDGEKVRHNAGRLAEVVLSCALAAEKVS
jgi:uncharacterized cofD-like protein